MKIFVYGISLAPMKVLKAIVMVLFIAGAVRAHGTEPAESAERIVEDDISRMTGDPRGINDEKDVSGLITALQEKEMQLQAALDEIKRLRSWIKKIRAASEQDKAFFHYNMGCIYKFNKQYAKAEREFLQALQITPDNPDIHYNLGILYDDDLEKKDMARKHYERFIELTPVEKDRAQVAEWISSL